MQSAHFYYDVEPTQACHPGDLTSYSPLKTITFDTGESPCSAQKLARFGFSTTYIQGVNCYAPDGYFCFLKTIEGNIGKWHTGAIDHTSHEQAPGYMLFFNINYAGGEFVRANLSGLIIGRQYYFSAYFANVARTGHDPASPDIMFQVRAIDNTNILLGETRTGPIAGSETMVWHKHGIRFVAQSNAVTVLMLSNVAGGFGNDLVIDDIEIRGCI